MSIRIIDVDPQGDLALSLLREAAIDVRPLYSTGDPTATAMPTNLPLRSREVYIVATLDDVPAACGALRELTDSTGEICRMYVHRDYRRRRLGWTVLRHLVAEARRLGYRRVRLETGNMQTSAMMLYESFGLRRIPPFGAYANDPTSVCYELELEASEHSAGEFPGSAAG